MMVGDLYITTMADEIRLGDFDQVVLTERRVPVKERVTRGPGLTDTLTRPYPAEVLTVADGDTEFTEDVDFTFDALAGTLTWIDGQGEPDHQVYTAHYLYAPVYWYTGSAMTAPRPMPGWTRQMPQTGKLEIKHPSSEG